MLLNALFRPSGTAFDSAFHASSAPASCEPLDTYQRRVSRSVADAPLGTSANDLVRGPCPHAFDGPDVVKFPLRKHQSCRHGLCPAHYEEGGLIVRSGLTPGSSWHGTGHEPGRSP